MARRGSIFAFHKPRGLTIEQASAPTAGAGGRKLTLNDWIGIIQQRHPAASGSAGSAKGRRLSAVGRLDKETTGLLLLSDEGAVHERVLRPGGVSKLYEAVVKLRAPARPSRLDELIRGVSLPDGEARASAVEIIDEWTEDAPTQWLSHGKGCKRKREAAAAEEAAGAESSPAHDAPADSPSGASGAPAAERKALPATNVFVVRLCVAMGRNRVVRRMLAAIGLPVFGLKRVQIGRLHLEHDLALHKEGDSCRLNAEQERKLREDCGLDFSMSGSLPLA
ncbi:hypothetical protein AB1Y20_003277 [Prymnesium parvum]|uniref:Pseudouridine synthase RsuA/RluA-like domain-containing protein n=1 Tax=Prymnesium parvum TaxID=97485 RepID=A0AB34JDD8_PRYPA